MLWVQLSIIGLVVGAGYALAALGLVLTYNGSGVLNFAHLASGAIAAYLYTDVIDAGLGKWAALIVALLAGAALGAGQYLLVQRPLRHAPSLTKLVATFGVLTLLQGVTILVWGTDARSVTSLFEAATVTVSVGGSNYVIGYDVLTVVPLTIVLAALAALVMARTTLGRAIRASAVNERSATRLGYRATRLGTYTWAVGGALAALAAILITTSIQLSPGILTGALIAGLAAALVGGFRSITLTVVGAFALGVGQSVLVGYVSTPGLRDSLPFFVIAAFLIIRSNAIPGRDSVVVERLPAMPRARTNWLLVVLAPAALLVLPVVFSTYWTFNLSIGVALAPVVLSLVVVTGWLGQISLAQSALAAFGSFTAAELANHGWSMVPAVLAAAVLAFPLGVVVGWPALRVRGPSLAVLSLGAGIAIESLYLKQRYGTVETNVPRPDLFGVTLSQVQMAYFVIVVLLLLSLGLFAVRRTRWGQRLVAIRASERAATASGIPVRRTKLTAFGLASSVAALGGGFWAFVVGTLTTDGLDPLAGVQQLVSGMVTGITSIFGGAVAGGANYVGPPFFSGSLGVDAVWFSVISGALVLLTVFTKPDGGLVRSTSTGRRRRSPRWLVRAGSSAATPSTPGAAGPTAAVEQAERADPAEQTGATEPAGALPQAGSGDAMGPAGPAVRARTDRVDQ